MCDPSSPRDLSSQHIAATINNSSVWLLHNPLHASLGICTLFSPGAKTLM